MTFAPPRPAGRMEWTFYQQRRGDAVERPIGHVETSETLDAASTRLLIATHWLPPFESIDTMLVDATTLAPMREYSRSPQLTFTYRYDRAHVVGRLQHADSTPHEVGGSYDALVFGFNELDQLARAFEGPPGTRVVLPFFSEADADVEHDTLSVLRDTVVDGAPARVVRFADPVIVRLYLLTTREHEIVESDITQRRSGTRFRLVPVRQPSGLTPPSLGTESTHYRLVPRGRTQSDTTEWSVEQRPVTDHRRVAALQVMTSRRGSAVTVDSVVYDPRTLVAFSERTFGADTQVVAFGERATGWQSTSTSSQQTLDVSTPGFVYSSTMDNLVIRALPLSVGYKRVLPFWDGGRLEMDTVEVRASGEANADSAAAREWIVDFGEPYAVETLWIDRATRRIVRHVYTWRRDGTSSEVIASP